MTGEAAAAARAKGAGYRLRPRPPLPLPDLELLLVRARLPVLFRARLLVALVLEAFFLAAPFEARFRADELDERFRAVLPDDRLLAVVPDARFRDPAAFRLRVAAPFRADAERADLDREADARPPARPPFRAGAVLVFFPRPAPLFRPPPDILFSVAHARRSASFFGTPRLS
jgi:hypothetical protein